MEKGKRKSISSKLEIIGRQKEFKATFGRHHGGTFLAWKASTQIESWFWVGWLVGYCFPYLCLLACWLAAWALHSTFSREESQPDEQERRPNDRVARVQSTVINIVIQFICLKIPLSVL